MSSSAPRSSGAVRPVSASGSASKSIDSESSAAAAAAAGSGASTSAAAQSSRRKASLLRDYYNLPPSSPSGTSSPASASGSGTGAVKGTATGPGAGAGKGKGKGKSVPAIQVDPLDPDAGDAFDARRAYAQLVGKSNLADLLRYQSRMISEIRELDGERQSLVYNHHHELVAASDTIRKMKARADSLEPSLDSLRTSFSEMSHLCADLAVPTEMLPAPPPTDPPAPSSDADEELTTSDLIELARLPARLGDLFALARGVRPDGSVPVPTTPSRLSAPRTASTVSVARSTPLPSPSLPPTPQDEAQRERAEEQERQRRDGLVREAEEMWARQEPRLERASKAGVKGAKEVLTEARTVMREGRQRTKGL